LKASRDLVELVGPVLDPPVQVQRRRRPRKVVASRKSGNGDEMAGDEEVKNVEDEERDEKRLGRLACEDDKSPVQEIAVDFAARRLDIKGPDRTLCAADDVIERIFSGNAGVRAALADGDVKGIRAIDDLAYLGRANAGQANNAVELQLQLVLIEGPEALGQARKVASADLVKTRLDDADLMIVVEVELERSQRQRNERAEQQHRCKQAESDPAAQPVDDPCGMKSRQGRCERRSDRAPIPLLRRQAQ
jgi:hypothetical protein